MKKVLVSSIAIAAALAAPHAQAMEAAGSSNETYYATGQTDSLRHSVLSVGIISSGWSKIIVAAKDDAANMIATNGAIRGVALQQAFDVIRAANPGLVASDLQLAEAILKITVSN